jgi:hypothetical protein
MQDICRQRLVHAGTLGAPRNGGACLDRISHSRLITIPMLQVWPHPPASPYPGRREPSAGGDEMAR